MVTIIKKGTPIGKMKKLLKEAFSKTPSKNLRKYAGILHTDIDPLEYQKQMRNEWGIGFLSILTSCYIFLRGMKK